MLVSTEYLNIKDTHAQSLKADIDELVKLLTSIVKPSRLNDELKTKNYKLRIIGISYKIGDGFRVSNL